MLKLAMDIFNALEVFESFNLCEGLKGYGHIMSCTGGVMSNSVWKSANCSQIGSDVVCQPCKLLIPLLQSRYYRMKKRKDGRKLVLQKTLSYYKQVIKGYRKRRQKDRSNLQGLRISLKRMEALKLEECMKELNLPHNIRLSILQSLKMATTKSSKGMRYVSNCTFMA